jgi:YidC/Oxa1 family membrane protein insertase
MSKNSPKGPAGQGQAQQPNWWLAAIWALTAVLLFRTCSQTPPAGPIIDSSKLRDTLVAQNAQLKEVTAQKTFQDYTAQLGSQEENFKSLLKSKQADKGSIDAKIADVEEKKAEATILYADALLRAGEKTNRFDRYQDAYQTLYTLQQSQGEKPNWTNLQVKLPANDDGPSRVVTPAQIYDKSVKELSEANKSHPVWGFIPGYQLIDGLVHLTGAVPGFSYWFAALLLAVLVRSIAWPLSQRQLMFTRQMAQLTPLVKEIQEKYKTNDAMKNTKTMELYAEYGINPAAGCLPALVQIPFFFAIYQCMLQYRFDFQKGLFLWIGPKMAEMTHGFTAPNLGQPDNVLILLYAASMLTSTLMMPVSDPAQAKQQRLTGVIVSLLFPVLMLSRAYPLPCAFVLYWTFTNVLTTLQTLRAYRLPTPPLVKRVTSVGGVITAAPRKQSFWEKLQEQAAAQLEEKQRQVEAANQAKSLDDGKGAGDKPANKKVSEEKKPSSDLNGLSPESKNGQAGEDASKNGQPKPGNKSKPKRRT